MKIYVQLWQYLSELFLKWAVFQKNILEKVKTHILYSRSFLFFFFFFFSKSCRLWDNVEKYYRTRQVADYNDTAHALCMPDN